MYGKQFICVSFRSVMPSEVIANHDLSIRIVADQLIVCSLQFAIFPQCIKEMRREERGERREEKGERRESVGVLECWRRNEEDTVEVLKCL